MTSSDFDLNAFLPYQLAVLASRISRDFGRIYGERFGISVAEWRVIAHLGQSGAVSVREIHSRVDMDKSKVSRAASRLEELGYVTKSVNPDDRRLLRLALTPQGEALRQEIVPLARAYEEEILGQLAKDGATGFRNAVALLLKKGGDP